MIYESRPVISVMILAMSLAGCKFRTSGPSKSLSNQGDLQNTQILDENECRESLEKFTHDGETFYWDFQGTVISADQLSRYCGLESSTAASRGSQSSAPSNKSTVYESTKPSQAQIAALQVCYTSESQLNPTQISVIEDLLEDPWSLILLSEDSNNLTLKPCQDIDKNSSFVFRIVHDFMAEAFPFGNSETTGPYVYPSYRGPIRASMVLPRRGDGEETAIKADFHFVFGRALGLVNQESKNTRYPECLGSLYEDRSGRPPNFHLPYNNGSIMSHPDTGGSHRCQKAGYNTEITYADLESLSLRLDWFKIADRSRRIPLFYKSLQIDPFYTEQNSTNVAHVQAAYWDSLGISIPLLGSIMKWFPSDKNKRVCGRIDRHYDYCLTQSDSGINVSTKLARPLTHLNKRRLYLNVSATIREDSFRRECYSENWNSKNLITDPCDMPLENRQEPRITITPPKATYSYQIKYSDIDDWLRIFIRSGGRGIHAEKTIRWGDNNTGTISIGNGTTGWEVPTTGNGGRQINLEFENKSHTGGYNVSLIKINNLTNEQEEVCKWKQSFKKEQNRLYKNWWINGDGKFSCNR